MGNSQKAWDGKTTGGRGGPQVMYTVDKRVRGRERRWGQGRHLPEDLFHRNQVTQPGGGQRQALTQGLQSLWVV